MNFSNYENFKNYCLEIADNKQYIVSDEFLEIFDKFEAVVRLLNLLQDNNVIRLKNNILDEICNKFNNNNFEKVLSDMKYSFKQVHRFLKDEDDFYYVTTYLNRKFNLDLEFEDDFILSDKSKESPFYPSRIKCLEIKNAKEKKYSIDEFDTYYKDKYGIYFIYNEKNQIVYIGKSYSCLLTRAFASLKEIQCLNFSKIELRECKYKSDIAIYESYYISLYKPQYNSKDLIFKDTPSIQLPELAISRTIYRDIEQDCFIYTYSYINSRVMNINEFIDLATKGYAYLYTTENMEYFKDKGIYLNHGNM